MIHRDDRVQTDTETLPGFSLPVGYSGPRTRRDSRGRAFCGTDPHRQRETARVCAPVRSRIFHRDGSGAGRVGSRSKNPVHLVPRKGGGTCPPLSCLTENCSYYFILRSCRASIYSGADAPSKCTCAHTMSPLRDTLSNWPVGSTGLGVNATLVTPFRYSTVLVASSLRYGLFIVILLCGLTAGLFYLRTVYQTRLGLSRGKIIIF